MSTATKPRTVRRALDQGNPQDLADLIKSMKLGRMLSPLKVTVAALAATQNVDITSAAVKAAATIVGALSDIDVGDMLPAILSCTTLRITASGTAGSLGAYIVTDAGGTAIVPPGGASAAVGVATLSDDGKTIGFPNTVTGFVIEYIPRPAVDMSSLFPAATIQ